LARTDEGEFELVLGNKQLISVFLVVVILLAVFFSMGYIVGRSSSPTTAEATHPVTKDIAVDRSPAPATTTAEKPPPPVESKPAEVHPEKPSPVTIKDTVKETKPAPAPVIPSKPATGEPAAGEYWQVVATSKEDADIVSRALTNKGFHTVIAPVPGDNRYRVLVGPLANAAAQAQTRSDLEASGFKNPIMRKY